MGRDVQKWTNGAGVRQHQGRARVAAVARLLGMGCVLAIATSNTRKYPLGTLKNAV